MDLTAEVMDARAMSKKTVKSAISQSFAHIWFDLSAQIVASACRARKYMKERAHSRRVHSFVFYCYNIKVCRGITARDGRHILIKSGLTFDGYSGE